MFINSNRWFWFVIDTAEVLNHNLPYVPIIFDQA